MLQELIALAVAAESPVELAAAVARTLAAVAVQAAAAELAAAGHASQATEASAPHKMEKRLQRLAFHSLAIRIAAVVDVMEAFVASSSTQHLHQPHPVVVSSWRELLRWNRSQIHRKGWREELMMPCCLL